MKKAIIVYGSTMGNTEELAIKLEEVLSSNYDTFIKDVVNVAPEDLNEFDLILFGSSTWGAGELQDDFLDFYDRLSGIDLSDKQAAVFGPGDTSYGDMFCQAVDILEDKLKDLGAEIITEGFKWDGEITSEAKEEIEIWADNLSG
ncbi:flavodoxin [Sporohalobacter salinus]|uniref:flavodoxin n=1 Tax=Sporohalobacter salinus TaxID=1494606 RepID=UPI0019614A49|nr:flavodoxin [Sporohalobacter salinus]MBM7624552.1 flavodoxin I [Sporohalobacter salinus]